MTGGLRVALVGASGYGGGELLRLLAGHPSVVVHAATSRRHAGRPVADVHENLLGLTDLTFTDAAPEALAREVDAIFFALPHGEASTRMRAVLDASDSVRVVDLSGDFRLRDPAAWEAAYGRPHAAPDLTKGFEYGMPELFRDRIRSARLVANPGCFATGAILALAPLAKAGLLGGTTIVNGVTGSSGSGADPKPGTHHPERAEDFRAYRPLVHQHVPEIESALGETGGEEVRIALVTHSAPLVRGIFTTAYPTPSEPLPEDRVRGIFEDFYRDEPFVRIRLQSPRLAVVRGTNFCDLHALSGAGGSPVVVMTAIDNLGKGMAGTAIQNLNLLFGLPETEGLSLTGTHP